ncbi:hypothetical protein ACIGFK_13135 [Streptomyces sp. NPDC085524]|uniref:hypothetical protein n=1 Tax=Streptomyces sp. NPDC085524 TaxID=3365728 RepID=UPI0037D30A14
MPDLHDWISQQIDEVEARAHACPPATAIVEGEIGEYAPIEVRTDAGQGYAVGLLVAASAVLRRCAADRKILDIHSYAGGFCEPYACAGCGHDDMGYLVDHCNDCETLLALAEGYGLTDEARAQLDRPERPRPEPDERPAWDTFGRSLDELLRPITPTSDVPAALRGPNWKPRPTA